MTKPNKLYRGISINSSQFDKLDLNASIQPPKPPKINEDGRKVVNDGNEYGVYMTDNLTMARDVYGNCHTAGDKIQIFPQSVSFRMVALPRIGIVFEIDTAGLDIRRPWIRPELKGHYNNGYAGDEWIADMVPAENVSLNRIVIGADVLNKQKEIDITKSEAEIRTEISEILEKRERGLRMCCEAIEKLQPTSIDSYKQVLVALYAEDGIAFSQEQSDVSMPSDLIKNEMIGIYKKNSANPDMRTLQYLQKLQEAYQDERDFDPMMENISRQISILTNGCEKQREMGRDTSDAESKIAYFRGLFEKLENINEKSSNNEEC